MNTQLYIKQFSSKDDLKREITGYYFFQKYFSHKMPKLVGISETELSISYQDIINQQQTLLSNAIELNFKINLKEFFENIALNVNNFSTMRKSEGGTRYFFLDRKNLLMQKHLLTDYLIFADQMYANINDMQVILNKNMFEVLEDYLDKLTNGLCYPSQGDLHERNIVLPGYFIDFEAGGWNLLSTDIATFIWHTLFAGNYYGKKYGKWTDVNIRDSIIDDDVAYSLVSKDGVSIQVNIQRIVLYKQFCDHFLSNIDKNIDMKTINLSIAFRLLTTFDLNKMSAEDRNFSYTLASYFMNNSSVDIRDKISYLLAKVDL